jgi:transposase-like protein
MRLIETPSRCPFCRSPHCGLNLRRPGPGAAVYICAQCKREWRVKFRNGKEQQ